MIVTKSREICRRKCRLCMKSGVFLTFLFERSGALTNIAKAIKDLLQYEISRDDKYPSFVCCNCSDKLWEFKEFKEKCDYLKYSFEATLSSKPKFPAMHNTTLVKHEANEIKAQEEHGYFGTKERGKETYENDSEKSIPSTKLLSVKEEELPEYNMQNYEVFMESIAAENMENDRIVDHMEISFEEQADSQVTKQGIEPLDCQETKNKKSQDFDHCMQIVEDKTVSAAEGVEVNDMEESDIELLLSDSDCEVLEHCVVNISKGQEVKNKKRTSPHLIDSDSDSDVQILDPITESGTRGLEINGKENLHSLQDVTDSESELQILESDAAAHAKENDSFCRENSQSPAKKDTNKIVKQRTLTSYFVRHVTSPRQDGKRKDDLTSVEYSIKCFDHANLPSASRPGVNGKVNAIDICLRESNTCKTSSEYQDKGIRLILRPELNDNDQEEIAHLGVNNGSMRWSFETIGRPVTENVMLHINEYDDIGLKELRAPEVEVVDKSTNAVTGMGFRKITEVVYPVVGERGKNQSDDEANNSGQSHKSESFTYISHYKATEAHKCSRCGKQFQNYEKLKKHMSMDRTIHCQYCSLSFKNDSELFNHLPSHDGEVKWSCGNCGKKSVKWKDVWVHIQVHRQAHFYKQSLSISNQNSSLGNICKVCHKRMPNKRSLRMHLLSHSKESKWVCPHCEENFTEQGSLIHHIETHNKIMQSSN